MRGMMALGRRLGLFLLIFAVIAYIVMRCSDSIKFSFNSELESNVRLVTENNARVLEEELNGRQQVLRNISAAAGRRLAVTGSIEDVMVHLKALNEIYGFKRLSYVDNTGMAYTTDNIVEDISFRDFYKRSIAGQSVITERFMDTMGGGRDYINAFSVPVYSGGDERGEVVGVVWAAYQNKAFQDRLNMDLFTRYGNAVIIDSSGGLVSARESMTVGSYGQNLFVIISAGGEENASEVALMREDLKAGQSGTRHFKGYGGQCVHYRPLKLANEGQTWYIVTIVSKQTLDKELDMVIGDIVWMLTSVLGLLGLALLLFFFDTHRQWKAQEKLLKEYAYEDTLTGGDNYNRFKENLRKVQQSGFLIVFDLQNFKIINSAYGTQKGDEVLKAVWNCLEKWLEKDDFAGHLNGDHFVAFCAVEQEELVRDRLEMLTKDLAVLSDELDVPVLMPCYGVTCWYNAQDPRYKEIEASYNEASSAKNEAKRSSDENIAFFRQADTERLLVEQELENAFQTALDGHEFEVWYQPKFNPGNSEIVGAEALVRWRRVNGQLIPPGKFIPLFERNGMIRQLDEYVFAEVCRLQKVRTSMRQKIVPISVNISRTSLYSKNVVEKYLHIVRSLEIDLKAIPLEITESAAVNDEAIKEVAYEFSHNGFRLHLDDFGSGYSSLASLNTMNFHELKLDKSLIDFIGNYRGDRLLEHTISLAKELGIHVTAEGVEENRQAVALMNMGCDSIQGFYFSKPLPLMDFVQRLDAQVGVKINLARKQRQVALIDKSKTDWILAGDVFKEETLDKLVGPVVCYRVQENKIELTHVNAEYCSLMGCRMTEDGRLEQDGAAKLHPDDQASFVDCFARAAAYSSHTVEHEVRILHNDDRITWVLLNMHYLRNTEAGQEFAVNFKDVTAKHIHEQAIMAMTEVDPLLGIYNRHQIEKMIRSYMVEHTEESLALIMLDVDNFKQLNEVFGRAMGDRILKETAYRVQTYFGDKVILGRFGGDELLLLHKHAGGSDFRERLEEFAAMLGSDYEADGRTAKVTLSVGCSLYPWHGRDFDELFSLTSMALFAAKLKGKNCAAIYDENVRQLAGEHFSMNLHEVLVGMPGGFLIYRNNKQGTLLYANERLLNLFGCGSFAELRELTDNSFFNMMPSEQQDRVRKEIEEQITENNQHLDDYVEYDIRRKDGKLVRVVDYGHLVKNQLDGDLFYVFINEKSYNRPVAGE